MTLVRQRFSTQSERAMTNRITPFFTLRLCAGLLALALIATGPAAAQDARVHEAQKILLMLGLEPERPNGQIGPKTTRALQAFQKQQKLPTTGQLDATTFETLRRVRDTQIGGSFGTPPAPGSPAAKPKPVIQPKAPEAQPVEAVDATALPGVATLPNAPNSSVVPSLPPPIGGSKGASATASYSQPYMVPSPNLMPGGPVAASQPQGPTWHSDMPIWLWVVIPLALIVVGWRVRAYLAAPTGLAPVFDEDGTPRRAKREPTL